MSGRLWMAPLVAAICVAMAGCDQSSPPASGGRTEVKGETASRAPVEPPPSSPHVPVAAPRPAAGAGTGASPSQPAQPRERSRSVSGGPSRQATAPSRATAGRTSSARFTEDSDNQGSFDVVAGQPRQQVSSTRAARSSSDRLRFFGYVRPQDGRTADLEAQLTNTSGRPMRFPGGVRVVFSVSHDGRRLPDTVVSAPGVVQLSPGQSVTVRGSTSLAGDGSYSYSAQTSFELD